jgi:hypothetical protein
MSMTKKNELQKCFMEAIEEGAKSVYVEVFMDNFPSSELIVNPIDNALGKLDYYNNAYDDNLQHNHSKGIRIIDFGYSLDEVLEIQYTYNEGEDKE